MEVIDHLAYLDIVNFFYRVKIMFYVIDKKVYFW